MNSKTIHMLAGDVVDLLQRWALPDNFRRVGQNLNKHQRQVAAFILNYGDLALGWKAGGLFARSRELFPVYLTGDDHWLWKGYLVQCDPDRYHDPHVARARALYDPAMTSMRETLEALLLCEDASVTDIADILSVDTDTVCAYEKLFYNVRDRLDDFGFLAQVVYPHGRLEEIYDGYLGNATYGALLKRIGYNSGRDYVTYMAGIRSNLLNEMGTGDIALQLERVVMSNGFILAHSGALNQRRDAYGINSAKNLIAAAKHGGNDQHEVSGFEDTSVAAALRGEMVEAGRAGLSQAVASSFKDFDGPILDAEMVDGGT